MGFRPWHVGQVKDTQASQVMLVVKNLPASMGGLRDLGLIPGREASLGGDHSNPPHPLGNPGSQRRLAGYGPQGHTEGHDCSDSVPTT